MKLAISATAVVVAMGAATPRAAATPAIATDVRADPSTEPPAVKKFESSRGEAAMSSEDRDRYQRELDERIGEKPPELLNIRNLWTRETLAVPRDPDLEVGEDVKPELVDWFLRCRFTHEPSDMDERLIPVLVSAAERFDADRVEVISGYRSQKHNLNLRKKGSRVARNSQHTHGTAVDFRIPGVHVARLHRWARSLRLGGVGYYPRSGFVHVDTADVRYWTVR